MRAATAGQNYRAEFDRLGPVSTRIRMQDYGADLVYCVDSAGR